MGFFYTIFIIILWCGPFLLPAYFYYPNWFETDKYWYISPEARKQKLYTLDSAESIEKYLNSMFPEEYQKYLYHLNYEKQMCQLKIRIAGLSTYELRAEFSRYYRKWNEVKDDVLTIIKYLDGKSDFSKIGREYMDLNDKRFVIRRQLQFIIEEIHRRCQNGGPSHDFFLSLVQDRNAVNLETVKIMKEVGMPKWMIDKYLEEDAVQENLYVRNQFKDLEELNSYGFVLTKDIMDKVGLTKDEVAQLEEQQWALKEYSDLWRKFEKWGPGPASGIYYKEMMDYNKAVVGKGYEILNSYSKDIYGEQGPDFKRRMERDIQRDLEIITYRHRESYKRYIVRKKKLEKNNKSSTTEENVLDGYK